MRVDSSIQELVASLTGESEVVTRKDLAPAWSPVAYSGVRRLAAEAESVCALVYDLDHVFPAQLEGLSGALEREGWLYAIHETHTVGRYRLCVPLARDLEPSEFPEVWEAAAQTLGIWEAIDQACSDLARLFYAPSRPDPASPRFAYSDGQTLYNPAESRRLAASKPNVRYVAAQRRNPSELLGAPKPTEPTGAESPGEDESEKFFDLQGLREEISERRDDKREPLTQLLDGTLRVPPGQRENVLHPLLSALGWCRHAPPQWVVEDMLRKVLSLRDGANEQIEAWVTKALSSYERGHERKAKRDAEVAVVEKFFRDEDWKMSLKQKTDKTGAVIGLKPMEANIMAVLRNDEAWRGQVRWNMLKQRIEVLGGALGALHENARDSLDIPATEWFQTSAYNCETSRDMVGACLQHHALENPFDPVNEYLKKLPPWDGEKRLSTLLLKYANAEGAPDWVRLVTRKFFISAIARAMEPGCQVDSVLVLQGAQGGGKTSLVRVMGAGFHVETSLDLHNKDAVMTSAGNWLVELGELASLRKSDVESVRNFITRKEDQIRLPYGRSVKTMPRRCVFIGTTNSRQPLTDPEGNRRYWVVSVGKVDTDALEQVRDQIWAEAMHAYRAGEKWWLTQSESKRAEQEARVYEAEDITASELLHWLEETKQWPRFLTASTVAAKVLHRMVGSLTPQEASAINRTMASLGWKRERRRVAGKPTYCFVVPSREEMQKMWEHERLDDANFVDKVTEV